MVRNKLEKEFKCVNIIRHLEPWRISNNVVQTGKELVSEGNQRWPKRCRLDPHEARIRGYVLGLAGQPGRLVSKCTVIKATGYGARGSRFRGTAAERLLFLNGKSCNLKRVHRPGMEFESVLEGLI